MLAGVSTGALIAPFAFLGQDRDGALRRVFAEHDADDLMRPRPLQAMFGEALCGTAMVGELVGEGAAQERTVIGEAPDLAARLQGLAGRNGIVVGDLTRDLAGGARPRRVRRP